MLKDSGVFFFLKFNRVSLAFLFTAQVSKWSQDAMLMSFLTTQKGALSLLCLCLGG